jgi:replicative DNA helicase
MAGENGNVNVVDLAERSVLGAMLRHPETISPASLLLKRDYLRSFRHQVIFDAIVQLWNGGKPSDMASVADEVHRRGKIEDVGYAYLEELWNGSPTGAYVEHHARLIQEHAAVGGLRRLIAEIDHEAQNRAGPVEELLARAEQGIMGLAQMGIEAQAADLADEIDPAFGRFDERAKPGSRALGVLSGFRELDIKTAGFQPSQLAVVAARTSVGKTSFALAIARNVARTGLRVLFVSLEMSRADLVDKLLCSEAGIDSHRFRLGTSGEEEIQQLIKSGETLRKPPITFDDLPNQTMLRIAATARRLKNRGLGLVIVDYLQLVQPEDRKEPRYEQVGLICRRLKALAKELKVPVVALAQLNREVESRPNQQPRLADLRESGSIEQDADLVLLLHLTAPDGEIIEINVAKNRHGPRGQVSLVFKKDTMRFESNYHGFPV